MCEALPTPEILRFPGTLVNLVPSLLTEIWSVLPFAFSFLRISSLPRKEKDSSVFKPRALPSILLLLMPSLYLLFRMDPCSLRFAKLHLASLSLAPKFHRRASAPCPSAGPPPWPFPPRRKPLLDLFAPFFAAYSSRAYGKKRPLRSSTSLGISRRTVAPRALFYVLKPLCCPGNSAYPPNYR